MRVPVFAACAIAALSTSCNDYDLFRVSGYQQETFTNRADVLFVIDNSESMFDKAESLAVNFAKFIGSLERISDTRSFDGLSDAVSNYLEDTEIVTSSVDYQFAITTTSADNEKGALVGPLVTRTDKRIVDNFLEGLTCNATCFDSTLPRDSTHNCGDPVGQFLTQEYLECLCGSGWGNCGSAREEGLESTFLAMCRAVENPPRACFDDYIAPDGDKEESELVARDALTNEGMLRDGANLIVVVVSDEGDNSRRLDREEIPTAYEELFAQFDKRMTWVFVGPTLNEAQTDLRCPGTGSDFGVIRYNYLAFRSSGRTIDILDERCNPRDFDAALTELGELLTNLATTFPLQSVPVVDSITVVVDGRPVRRAEDLGPGPFGLTEFSDGWTYRFSDNSIQFWGNAIPGYEAEVRVYYEPIDGIPRELPF